jgi:hypothetical protein
MPANAAASKVASLQNQKTMPFEEWIKEIGDAGTTAAERSAEQDELRRHIDAEFIDINAYMLALVENND